MMYPLSNKEGKSVDWWFLYKLPRHIGPSKETTGFEFLYLDSESDEGLRFQDNTLDHNSSALALTLNNLFNKDTKADYVLWNDEVPPVKDNPHPPNKGTKGHSKGVLCFCRESNTGFYLLHSTPRFPTPGMSELPDYESSYGQVFLCVALDQLDTVEAIAQTLLSQDEVQVYASRISTDDTNTNLYKLAHDADTNKEDKPNCIKFSTPGGMDFHFMVKSRYWSKPTKDQPNGKDFWRDVVGPHLKCDFSVESWRRGLVFADKLKNIKEVAKDIVDIDLKPLGKNGYRWTFTKDHSKWGVSSSDDPAFVVISDINRQTSQSRRGGGGLGFQHKALWDALNKIKQDESAIETKAHKDKA